MESPIVIHEQLSHINNIKDIAFDRLFTNYLNLNLKGFDKLIEIDSTDQESLIKLYNFGMPIPGMIYTFWYISKEILILIDQGKQKEFIDFAPIVFCTTISPMKSFSGINFNMLPNLERLKFFKEYYELYKTFFEDIEELTENNKLAINKKFIVQSLTHKSQEMIKAFSKKQNAYFNYGYRKYNHPNVKQLRMIEFEEWAYISFYDPKNAFKKMNLKNIHDLYYKLK
jgi:hypothetical protein